MVSKLEKIRTERGLSQRKLESLSGVRQQQISLIEKGRAIQNLGQATKLARALNCNPSDLIDIDPAFDKLASSDTKNIHNFLSAALNLSDVNIRQVANLLCIDDTELKNYSKETSELNINEGLMLAFVSLFPFIAKQLAYTIRSKQTFNTADNKEREVITAFRSLTEEQKERFIHLIKATPLLG